MVVSLMGDHLAFNEIDHHWVLIGCVWLMFDFRSLFTLIGSARTLGSISFIGGLLSAKKVFFLLIYD
jgi:hypothetical protein